MATSKILSFIKLDSLKQIRLSDFNVFSIQDFGVKRIVKTTNSENYPTLITIDQFQLLSENFFKVTVIDGQGTERDTLFNSVQLKSVAQKTDGNTILRFLNGNQFTVTESVASVTALIDGSGPLDRPKGTGIKVYDVNTSSWIPSQKISTDYLWIFDDDTTASDPGTGYIRVDNVNPALITKIYISSTCIQGVNITDLFILMGPGTIINAKQWAALDHGGVAIVNSVTDNGDWFTLDVTPIIQGSNSIEDGESVDFNILKLVSPPPVNIYSEVDAQSPTTSFGDWIKRVEIDLPAIPQGDYELHYSCEMHNGHTNGSVDVKVEADAVEIALAEIEPKDTDNWYGFSGFKRVAHAGGAFNMSMYWRNVGQGNASIRRSRLILKEL